MTMTESLPLYIYVDGSSARTGEDLSLIHI